jgi:hypothetical protein
MKKQEGLSRDNVRISPKGLALLDNKELANKVAIAISEGKTDFREGKDVVVDQVVVKMVTSLNTSIAEKASHPKDTK